jgi:CRISPR-associated protein Csx17
MSAGAGEPAVVDTPTGERLLGCSASTLDAYLRALGFLALAGKVDPRVRGWWGEDEVLRVVAEGGVDGLIERVAAAAAEDALGLAGPVETPWRGKPGADRSFVEMRNAAREEALDWYDACAVPGAGGAEKRNNPLLGQGGGFGHAELVPAFRESIELLKTHRGDHELLRGVLASSLRAEPLDRAAARTLSIKKKVLGAYQSGRGTGPGSSVRDVDPSGQSAWTSAWDILLVFSGLRLFAGAATRRPDPGAREQTSFPLLVRARAVALDESNDVQLREDDAGTYELLAPLWSWPATARTVRHLLRTARLRNRGRVARDTLDAILAQAARAARQVGFDRLVRFVFVAPSDPRYRYALRRGSVAARASRASWLAMRDVLPFLRAAERALGLSEAPARVRRAHRDLANAVARLDRAAEEPTLVQQMLVALARFEVVIGPALDDRSRYRLELPRLGADWLTVASDGSAHWRLALALAWRHRAQPDGRDSWLRADLLGQEVEEGRWHHKANHAYSGGGRRQLSAVAATALRSLRSLEPRSLEPIGWPARAEDVVVLLGSDGLDADRLADTVAGATLIASPRDGQPPPASALSPAAAAIGGALATLLLAAHPAADEHEDDARGRRAELVALALSGRPEAALRRASRELWRRGFMFAPWSGARRLALSPSRLAVALVLELSGQAQESLAERIDPTVTTRGGAAL